MKSVTLNQFAPEALYLNEYSSATDVWSTAIVIWDIISAGKYMKEKQEIIRRLRDEYELTTLYAN